jgi:hypothetical protein
VASQSHMVMDTFPDLGRSKTLGISSHPRYSMVSTNPTVSYRLRESRLGTASCTVRNRIHGIRVLQHWINSFSALRVRDCCHGYRSLDPWSIQLGFDYTRKSALPRKHRFHCSSMFLSLGDQRPSHFIGSCLRFPLWCYHGSLPCIRRHDP